MENMTGESAPSNTISGTPETENHIDSAWISYISEDLPRTVAESADSAVRSARSLQQDTSSHIRTLQVMSSSKSLPRGRAGSHAACVISRDRAGSRAAGVISRDQAGSSSKSLPRDRAGCVIWRDGAGSSSSKSLPSSAPSEEGCIDMQKLHKMFISLNSCTHHGDFLDVLTLLRRIPQDLKVSCVYKAYLTTELEYLVRFYKCAKPVEDLHHIFSKHTLNLNDQYDDIEVVASLEARITILCETLSKEKEDNSPLLLKGNSSNFTLRSDIKKILLSHQIEGVKWLWGLHLEEAGGGGILADGMGVGKTLQIAAFILGLFESDLTKKVLVVCPKTLLSVWFNQFSKMGLPPKNYSGRKKCVELEEFKQKEKGILLTSYGMITKGSNTLCQMTFDYSILDEGHIIKNPKSKTSINIRSIKSAHRIIVTGTPIQNNLEELWSLYNYCAPKILGDIKFFKDEVKPLKRGLGTNATTSDRRFRRDAKEKLDRAIRPYFLRRTIEQVFTKGEISEKTELVIWLKLSRCQQALYKGIVRSDIFGAARSSVPFAAITILRKVCCDPSLTRAWKDNEERTIGTMQEDKHKYNAQRLALKMDEITSSYGKELKSCKLSFIKLLVADLIKHKHNILIFSEWQQTLDIIQTSLEEKHYKCLRMSGESGILERDTIIRMFEDGDAPILLLTSKIGGVGLTLTKADRVILLDPAWNPSADNQSIHRAYRYGQRRSVVVYRIMTCGTVEEHIYKTQVNKGTMIRTVTEAEEQFSYFKPEEVKEIFSITNFTYSSTMTKMLQEHDHEWKLNPDLERHVAYLKSSSREIAGISNHSLLFSKKRDPPKVSKRLWYDDVIKPNQTCEEKVDGEERTAGGHKLQNAPLDQNVEIAPKGSLNGGSGPSSSLSVAEHVNENSMAYRGPRNPQVRPPTVPHPFIRAEKVDGEERTAGGHKFQNAPLDQNVEIAPKGSLNGGSGPSSSSIVAEHVNENSMAYRGPRNPQIRPLTTPGPHPVIRSGDFRVSRMGVHGPPVPYRGPRNPHPDYRVLNPQATRPPQPFMGPVSQMEAYGPPVPPYIGPPYPRAGPPTGPGMQGFPTSYYNPHGMPQPPYIGPPYPRAGPPTGPGMQGFTTSYYNPHGMPQPLYAMPHMVRPPINYNPPNQYRGMPPGPRNGDYFRP